MKSTPNLLILADDVTGAADCAARCKGVGLVATIVLHPTNLALPPGAVAFSSDSRYLAPPAAAARVRALAVALQQATANAEVIWYKKIDSTLRGNIGAELAALLALLPAATTQPCAIIAPGFPAHGRGLVDGALLYDGASPPRVHLPTLLAQQTALPQAAVNLAVVRAGVATLAAALAAESQAGAQLFVVDGLTDADLHTIYQATKLALPQALFCGSAGLMGVIAAALVAAQGATASAPMESLTESRPSIATPMLAVVGSGSGMAQRQLQRLRQTPGVDIYEVDLQQQRPMRLVVGDGSCAACTLHLPPPLPGAPLEGELARQYAVTLATVAQQLMQQRCPRTLLLVGGDTAVHLLATLGVEKLQVDAELLPGMPLTTAVTATGQQYQIILKAGNHGDEATLVTLFSYGTR